MWRGIIQWKWTFVRRLFPKRLETRKKRFFFLWCLTCSFTSRRLYIKHSSLSLVWTCAKRVFMFTLKYGMWWSAKKNQTRKKKYFVAKLSSQHKLNFYLWEIFICAMPTNYENKWHPYVLTFISGDFHHYTQRTVQMIFYKILYKLLKETFFFLTFHIFFFFVFFDCNPIFIFFY